MSCATLYSEQWKYNTHDATPTRRASANNDDLLPCVISCKIVMAGMQYLPLEVVLCGYLMLAWGPLHSWIERTCPGISGIRPIPLPKPKENTTWLTSKVRSPLSGRWTVTLHFFPFVPGMTDMTVALVQTSSSILCAYDSSQSASFNAGVYTGHDVGNLRNFWLDSHGWIEVRDLRNVWHVVIPYT